MGTSAKKTDVTKQMNVKINDLKFIRSLKDYSKLKKLIKRFTEDVKEFGEDNGVRIETHVTLEFTEVS